MPFPRLTFMPEAEERKTLSRAQRHFIDERDLKFKTNAAIFIAVLAGAAVAAFHGGNITVSLAAFGAALGLGGVLGFLFGVPVPGSSHPNETIDHPTVNMGQGSVVNVQAGAVNAPDLNGAAPPVNVPTNAADPVATAQGLNPPGDTANLDNRDGGSQVPPQPPNLQATPGPTPPAHFSPPSTNASNLEQVADWVTKLLLGGGLTQMSKIPPKVWQWSHAVAVGILGDAAICGKDTGCAQETVITATQAFAAGLLVYGFILGFFAGFLITKIQLGKAISS